MLSQKEYYKVIEKTTLVSVDLLCIYEKKVLLGKRNNEPAKGYLFNPGSRVYKYETQNDAIVRVGKNELGIDLSNKNVILLGSYDHIYNNNFIDNSFGTHYLTNAYVVYLEKEDVEQIQPDSQHEILEWYDINESLVNNLVHPYVKWFLLDLYNISK